MNAFALFGDAHVVTLAVIAALCVVVSRTASGDQHHRLARGIAIVLIIQELAKFYVFVGVYDAPWKNSLPLDLCRVNEFLCIYMLLRRSYRVFEVAWFWAMGGSVSALLTPDLAHGFPDVRFLLFFLGHGFAVLAALYAVFGYGFRPRLRSVAIALIATAALVLIAGAVNYLLDTNYLFLRSKPEAFSVLDLFGPWPYYLLGLCGIAIAACFLCYAPFAIARRWVWSKR